MRSGKTIDELPDPSPKSVAEGKVIGLKTYAHSLLRRVRGLARRLAGSRSFAEVAECDAELAALIRAHPLLLAEIGANNERGATLPPPGA